MTIEPLVFAVVIVLALAVGTLAGYVYGHRVGRSEMLRALQVVRAPGVPHSEGDLTDNLSAVQ